MPEFGNFMIVCGHYGCGKTNFSMNLAIRLTEEGRKVTLVDLDLVNPYFRTSDYAPVLEEKGIRLVAPIFAHSNLDLPAMPAEIESVFSIRDGTVIIDVGGDDAGATALGRYAGRIREMEGVQMLYLINRYRALTKSPEEAAALLREIETACRLKATGVVNNSHLQNNTTARDVEASMDFARRTAELLSLPLVLTTAPRCLQEELNAKIPDLFPVDRYVTPPWEVMG